MKTHRVLVVDDKEENLYLLRVLLLGHCYEVIEAHHGAEALELARRHPPDLIIADILMPIMDGFALCREWKRDAQLKQIPFIFYTATYTDERDRAFGLKLGAERFLIKPEDPDALLAHIRDTIQQAQRTPAANDAAVSGEPVEDEAIYLKQYNATLIRKLETKMAQLEQDLERRQKVEAELRQANAFLDSIVENIPAMVFLKDAQDLRFVRFNRAGENLLGYPKAALIGKNDYDLFPKEQADFFTRKDRDVLAGKEVVEIPEEPLQTKNKGERILRTRKVPVLNAKGEPEYLLGISEDVTAYKQAEKEREKLQLQLSHAQKMESVGRLAGGVAHDFNNMLSVILGNAELALQEVEPSHKIVAHLKEILQTAQRSAELTRQLLAFARKQVVEAQILDLNVVVAGLLKMLQRLIGEDIHLVWQPGDRLWPVKMDPSQMDQILANLCVNARDAIAGTGSVVIKTQNIGCDEAFCAKHTDAVPGDYVMLVVSDDGCGMAPEVQGRLFEPFFTTKEVGKGTGLGLATVYGIVKQNKGFIQVESELGRGTAFSIFLPRRAAAAPGQPAHHPKVSEARGHETILVVEDEAAILRLITIILEGFGYRALAAESPEEALRLAGQQKDHIHLLITDVVMPGMSGPDLAAQLTGLHPELKCLFMSGHAHNVMVERGLDNIVGPFIQKPFRMQDLAAKIRIVLGAAP